VVGMTRQKKSGKSAAWLSYVQDVPNEQVSRLVGNGKLEATSDFSALQAADAVSISSQPRCETGESGSAHYFDATESLIEIYAL